VIRNGINRLLVVVFAAALAVFALFVAIEAVASLLGEDGHVGPIDYRSAWRSLQDWNPSDELRTVIFGGVALLGLLLLAFQLPWRRRPRAVEVARTDQGPVLLDTQRLRSVLGERIARPDWVVSAAPRVRLKGRQARVSVSPQTRRPWADGELAAAREGVSDDLRRLGLEPGSIEVTPRAPRGRRAQRVQ
jgi:hypothetical protein